MRASFCTNVNLTAKRNARFSTNHHLRLSLCHFHLCLWKDRFGTKPLPVSSRKSRNCEASIVAAGPITKENEPRFRLRCSRVSMERSQLHLVGERNHNCATQACDRLFTMTSGLRDLSYPSFRGVRPLAALLKSRKQFFDPQEWHSVASAGCNLACTCAMGTRSTWQTRNSGIS